MPQRRTHCFSFAPNSRWTRSFSAQPEIQGYLERCADRYGVREHIWFDCPLNSAQWQTDQQHWRLQTGRGEVRTQILISAPGALSDPAVPDLPGIENFTGTLFHSARWDHSHDLTGERVAVIGTGASAIQFVPQIQPKVEQLHLFQRTAPWIMPRLDRQLTRVERFLFRTFPSTARSARLSIYWGRELNVLGFIVNQRLLEAASKIAARHLERQVSDPVLRDKLAPSYTMGCKRVLISSDFYPAVGRVNVDVVTGGIREIRARYVVTADGAEREIDTIIFGTGFRVADPPIAHHIHGRDGASLATVWKGSPHAYLGTSVPGFPNLFLLVGPNTGLGHTSQLFMIEAQINYVLDAIKTMSAKGLATVEVEPARERAYAEAVDRRMSRTVWVKGGCNSWYLDANGKNSALWPGATFRFRSLTKKFQVDRYTTGSEPRATTGVGGVPGRVGP